MSWRRLDLLLFWLGVAFLLTHACGCYLEPEPRAWAGDRSTSTACHLVEAGFPVEVTAEMPIFCAALADNLHAAVEATDLPRTALMGLTIHIEDVDCLGDMGPDSSACTYAATYTDGADQTEWTGATIRMNRRATQTAHELWHVRAAWLNLGGNSQHQAPAWQPGDRERWEDVAAQSFAIHP
jgi:hypothetical protein